MSVVAALAVLDLGPCADAAYLTAGGPAEAAGLADDAPLPGDSHPVPTPPPPPDHLIPQDAGGCTTAPGGAGAGGDAPSAGMLPHGELLAGNLVLYYRVPAVHFELSTFIDTLLDPPRQG